MKNAIVLLLVFLLTISAVHKFYVSNSLIEYSPRSGLFEVTIKTFTDDLERAISERVQHPIALVAGEESPEMRQLLCDYFNSRFQLSVDDQPVVFQCVGYESEYDLTYFYMEVAHGPDFRSMTLRNTIFTDLFPEQKNIIDLSFPGWKQTLILTHEHDTEIVFK